TRPTGSASTRSVRVRSTRRCSEPPWTRPGSQRWCGRRSRLGESASPPKWPACSCTCSRRSRRSSPAPSWPSTAAGRRPDQIDGDVRLELDPVVDERAPRGHVARTNVGAHALALAQLGRAKAARARKAQLKLIAGAEPDRREPRQPLAVQVDLAELAGPPAAEAGRLANDLVGDEREDHLAPSDVADRDRLSEASATPARTRRVGPQLLAQEEDRRLRLHDLARGDDAVVGKGDGRHPVELRQRAAPAMREHVDDEAAVSL